MSDPIKLDSPNVERVEKKGPSDYKEIQNYVVQIVAQKLGDYDKSGDELLKLLKERQERVRFMHDFLREVNKSAQGQGDLNNIDTNGELKKFIDKGKEFEKTATSLEADAANLEKSAKIKSELAETQNRPELKQEADKELGQAKILRQRSTELKDVSKTINTLIDNKGNVKKKISKEERDRLVQNINTVVDDFNTINQMDFHKANQLNQDRQSLQLMARMIVKQLHDVITTINRGIRGN